MKLRTRYLIQPKFQLLFSGILTLIALVVALAVGTIIYLLIYSHNLIFVKYNIHTSPEFLNLLLKQGKMVTTTWILSFGAVAVILFIAGIFLSHRMAGPLYALLREMKKVREGNLNARLTLRKRDEFKNLKLPFNLWVESLQREAKDDIEKINRCLEAIDQLIQELEQKKNSSPELEQIRSKLLELKSNKQKQLSS